MSLVKNYRGVDIYVSPEGEFYCDVKFNSSKYHQKTVNSFKLLSIEKAIDGYKGEEIDGNSFYVIEPHSNDFKKIKVIKRIGNRLFFDDETDTSMWSRRDLYDESIENHPCFEEIKKSYDVILENARKIDFLYKRTNIERKIIEQHLKKLTKVVPY